MPAFRVAWRRRSRHAAPSVIPIDPRLVLDGPLDPDLEEIRSALRPQRRRLWLRRIVRRTWLVGVGVAAWEVVLFGVARMVPLEILPSLAIAIPPDHRSARRRSRSTPKRISATGSPVPSPWRWPSRTHPARRQRPRTSPTFPTLATTRRSRPSDSSAASGSTRQRPFGSSHPASSARGCPVDRPWQRSLQPSSSCLWSLSRTRRTTPSRGRRRSAIRRATKPIESSRSPAISNRRAPTRTIPEPASPRSCVTSPPRCAPSPRISSSTSPASAASRRMSGPSSIPRTSNGHRRCHRSVVPCPEPPLASRTPTRTATRRSPPPISRNSARSSMG